MYSQSFSSLKAPETSIQFNPKIKGDYVEIDVSDGQAKLIIETTFG